MKLKGLTFIEVITVIAIIMLLASLSGLAVKTISSSYRMPVTISAVKSVLGMGRSIARREGKYAGIYFYDQNDVCCTMTVVALTDYNVPHLRLDRLENSEITEIGAANDVNEVVVLFSKIGRLVIKDVEIKTYRANSSNFVNISGKNYYINPHTGGLIVP